MTLWNHTSRIYCDLLDVHGAKNALSDKLANEGADMTPLDRGRYEGALFVFAHMENVERMNTQADFIRVFEAQMLQANQLEEREAAYDDGGHFDLEAAVNGSAYDNARDYEVDRNLD